MGRSIVRSVGETALGLLGIVLTASVAFADTKVVDPGGGGDYLTIAAAIADLPNPGPRTVIVVAGTYAELVQIASRNTLAASEAARIVIQADPLATPGSVIVDPPGNNAFTVSNSKFITIQGFEITGSARESIVLSGGGSQNQNVTIDGNLIHDNGSTSDSGGIGVGSGNPNTWIVNNVLHHNGRNGITLGFGGSTSSGNPKYIVNNTIFESGWNGISTPAAEDVFIANNLIVGNGTMTGTTGGRWGILHLNAAQPARQRLFANVFYTNKQGDIDASVLDVTDSGNRTTTGAEPTGVVGPTFADALNTHLYTEIFVAPVTDDFHLVIDSPAIDRGQNSVFEGGIEWVPTEDFEGDVRPGGALVDAGFDEVAEETQEEEDEDEDGIPDDLDCSPSDYTDRVVDPDDVLLGLIDDSRRHDTLQAAVIAAADDERIDMFANTTENVIIGDTTSSGGDDLRIEGCGHRITAASAGSPVVHVEISAGADDGDTGAGERDIHIGDLDVRSGSVGYLVETSKDSTGTDTMLKAVRSESNGIGIDVDGDGNEVRGANGVKFSTSFGIRVVGNGNDINNNRVDENGGTGIDVTGDGNLVEKNKASSDSDTGNGSHGVAVHGDDNEVLENEAFGNLGDGVFVEGDDNVLEKNEAGDGGKGNAGNGVRVIGNSNTLEENEAYDSGLSGIVVTGNSNLLEKNEAGDSGTKANAGDGIRVLGHTNTIDENTSNGNGGDGFDVSGGTVGNANKLKDNESNEGSSGGSKENTGFEYRLDGTRLDQGGNEEDNAAVATGTSGALNIE